MSDGKMNKEVLDFYASKKFELEQFLAAIQTFFEKHPTLNKKPFPIIHSIKSRFKDPDHLTDKLQRKSNKGVTVTKENLFTKINDLIGIRILHLYQDQFPTIHEEIMKKVESGDWQLFEDPKAYTWDPESDKTYKDLSIKTELKESFYTSVHYVVKPNNQNPVCCEIQVRTLFEEIWGEIDHTINYPHPTDSIACKEQLRVLSKLVSTGTRLADSIFRSHNDYKKE
ncbi:MAG: RelA/SpoT domain-containing protein [Cytophagales bacterium]|nr:RelA/SpoT domain-containing protein [Cytophagales bacterium]